MATANSDIAELTSQLNSLAAGATSAQQLMEGITKLLHQKMLRYNWVGFYMLEKDGPQDVLVLGPFRGTMTPHTRIQLNQGICGAAASTGRTIIVDDVSADPRYLACSLETKSEIVVPIRAHDAVVGEIDIDSHDLAAFSAKDKEFLEKCAAIVGGFMERTQAVSSGAK